LRPFAAAHCVMEARLCGPISGETTAVLVPVEPGLKY
jgi:hypothetical protein